MSDKLLTTRQHTSQPSQTNEEANINTRLIFDLVNTSRPHPKRRKLDPLQSYHSPNTHGGEPTSLDEPDNLICLAERKIIASTRVSFSASDIPDEPQPYVSKNDGSTTVIIPDILLKVQNNSVLASCKDSSNRKALGVLVDLVLDPMQRPQVESEVHLLRLNPRIRATYGLSSSTVTLCCTIDLARQTIEISIEYTIHLRGSLYFPFNASIRNSLKTIFLDSLILLKSKEADRITNPQEFFETVSGSTLALSPIPNSVEFPGLSVELLPFQRKTLCWLLRRESVSWDALTSRWMPVPLLTHEVVSVFREMLKIGKSSAPDPGFLDTVLDALLDILNKYSFGWTAAEKHTSTHCEYYLFNRITANIILVYSACQLCIECFDGKNFIFPEFVPAQGVLAEEMGLGKTVEIAGLLCAGPRPSNQVDVPIKAQFSVHGDLKTVVQAKTTLIVVPDLILQQWVSEVRTVAPELKLCVYGGINLYPLLNNLAPLIARYLRCFDAVITTYQTISAELDYAVFTANAKNTRSLLRKLPSFYCSPNAADDEVEDDESYVPPAPRPGSKDELYRPRDDIKAKRPSRKLQALISTLSDYERALQESIVSDEKADELYGAHPYKHQSPLMLIQFWRVVVDESQMMTLATSRSFQIASLIPRFHAWTVSGTPMKRSLDDLHVVLKFLRYTPLDSKEAWKVLMDNSALFTELWSSICIRHTKAMVHSEIQLPPQKRILLTIPFSPFELHQYQEVFNRCMKKLDIDESGKPLFDHWDLSHYILSTLGFWLRVLRQVCFNPNIAPGSVVPGRVKKSKILTDLSDLNLTLKPLKTLLQDLVWRTFRDILVHEHRIAQLITDVAALFEFVYEPVAALNCLEIALGIVRQNIAIVIESLKMNNESPDVGEIDSKGTEADDQERKSLATSLRTWKLAEHRISFMIASSHFQQYDPEFKKFQSPLTGDAEQHVEELVGMMASQSCGDSSIEICATELGTAVDDLKRAISIYAQKVRDSENAVNEKGIEIPSGTDEQHRALELHFYSRAEAIRQELLLSAMAAVDDALESRVTSRGLSASFESEIFDDGESLVPQTSKKVTTGVLHVSIGRLNEIAHNSTSAHILRKWKDAMVILNAQATFLRRGMISLFGLLGRPLVSHNAAPDGEEYETSLNDQTSISCWLEVLQEALRDRFNYLFSMQPAASNVKKSWHDKIPQVVAQLEEWSRLGAASGDSVAIIFRDLENEMEIQKQPFLVEIHKNISNIMENQKRSFNLTHKELRNANFIFNCRIEFFKRLQQISDTVGIKEFGMNRQELDRDMVLRTIKQQRYRFSHQAMEKEKQVTRFRYLKSLDSKRQSGTSTGEMCCIICLDDISVGTLAPCGHKYCTECLNQWLRMHRYCPTCKSPISRETLFHFKHFEPTLKVVQEKDAGEIGEHDELHSIYHLLSRDEVSKIQQTPLKTSYSSKIDLIVKHASYLKSQDPDVQIVVFSQWLDLLYILASAFKAANISYVASHGTVIPRFESGIKSGRSTASKYDSVEQFKDRLRNITCFLLNAKAQASGLTLVNASHVFLCEPLVNTPLELQAISRVHRIGQRAPTTIWMFAIENTVEQYIVENSTRKRLEFARGNSKPEEANFNEEQEMVEMDSKALMESEGKQALVDPKQQGELVTGEDLIRSMFGYKNPLTQKLISVYSRRQNQAIDAA